MNSYLEEIKRELDEVIDLPPQIQEGDLTIKDICKMYDVNEKRAKRIMEDAAENSDRWEMIRVRSIRPSRPIWALRRIKPT